MPIRLTCPSCSATLSVKDEFAGRAVKCPKCAGVIPASAPAAPPAAAPSPTKTAAPVAASPPAAPAKSAPVPPEPKSEPAESPFGGLGTSAKSDKGSKATAKPASRAKNDDEDDEKPRPKDRTRDADEDDEKPRPKDRTRDEDDGDEGRSAKGTRGKKGGKDDGDEKSDRTKKRKRRDDDDDDDDRPVRGKKKGGAGGGGGGLMIALIICGTLLLICGGAGASVWYFVYRVKQGVNELVENAKTANWLVNRATYDRATVGTTTRSDMEQPLFLGPGRMATRGDLDKMFAGGVDADRKAAWGDQVEKMRAVIWQNGEDYILATFHPDGSSTSRLQMKEWRSKVGAPAWDGEPDDARFLQKYPPNKNPFDPPLKQPNDPFKQPNDPPVVVKDDEPPPGPLTEVSADDLARAYTAGEEAANGMYKDKWLLVEGAVLDVVNGADGAGADTVLLKLLGIKLPGGGDFTVWCDIRSAEVRTARDVSRGQTVKLKGKCLGGSVAQTYVSLKNCRIESKGPDQSLPAVTAVALLNEFRANPAAANEKYKDKEVTIVSARFVSATEDLVVFSGSLKGTLKIQANFTFGQRKKLEQLKPNTLVKFRARCGSLVGDTVPMYDAYLVQ